MEAQPIDDIVSWSMKLSPWRQDCLRRLAVSNDLTEPDIAELLGIIKKSSGFKVGDDVPVPEPFVKEHYGVSDNAPIVLKSLLNIKNINRLDKNAALTFCPKALTIIYGRNGSGKSGFVRILRTACRTRIENPAKLKVLSDVYGGGGGTQTADIIIDAGGGDIPIAWTSGMAAVPQLMQIAVFDTASAQIYVDNGNQIRFLPFGLALPHRLNTVCLTIRERLESERATAVGNKVSLTTIAFSVLRTTKSQAFDKALNKNTTDAEIENATCFGPDDQARLDEISRTLSAGAAAAADLAALATWVSSIAAECEVTVAALSDLALAKLSTLKESAVAARHAAEVSADALFTDEPLPGVGSESWRVLWAAARDYSVNEAYPERDFPVTDLDQGAAACVLCQQPLAADAATRMLRFQKYMDDTLDRTATAAEQALNDARGAIAELKLLGAVDFTDRLEQIRKRKPLLADKVSAFRNSAILRRTDATSRLNGEKATSLPPLTSPHIDLKELAEKLKSEKDALAKADEVQEREQLSAEKSDLEDRKLLSVNREKLITRRDLLATDALYVKALAEVQTKGITERANQFLDTHLSSAVISRFDAEREGFDIMHLRACLRRIPRTAAM